MYCANCGVKLADTEKVCPLCGVTAYHPEITRKEADPLYTADRGNVYHQVNSKTPPIIVTTTFLLASLIVLIIDLQVNKAVSWSGFVSGALFLTYTMFVLPTWFRKPNPMIFIPLDFVVAILYLLYINLTVNGDWFLSLAFPITAGFGIIVTVVTALLRYIRCGKLYIIGGAMVSLGLLMPVIELLIYITFDLSRFIAWCIYPALVLVILGVMLIFLAINDHAREAMEKKFFI